MQKKDVNWEIKKQVQKDKTEKISAPQNPLWVDSFTVGLREDAMCMLLFSASLPEGRIEQARIITSPAYLKKFVDVVCSALDYYPEKTNIDIDNQK